MIGDSDLVTIATYHKLEYCFLETTKSKENTKKKGRVQRNTQNKRIGKRRVLKIVNIKWAWQWFYCFYKVYRRQIWFTEGKALNRKWPKEIENEKLY